VFSSDFLLIFFSSDFYLAMAPSGRQKPKKASKVFFARWIPGINSYSDIRQEMQTVL
jgi:hypothetical protein